MDPQLKQSAHPKRQSEQSKTSSRQKKEAQSQKSKQDLAKPCKFEELKGEFIIKREIGRGTFLLNFQALTAWSSKPLRTIQMTSTRKASSATTQ